MDPTTDGSQVQPEGQGQESTEPSGGDLGDFYDMSQVPEEQRQFVEPILKDVQSNVNKKIEQLNGRYTPYQQLVDLNLHESNPDLIDDLATLAQIADDPNALQEWWNELGSANQWFDEDEEVLDGELGDDEEISQEDIQQFQQAIEQAIDSRTAPLYEREAAREQEQAIQEADQRIGSQLKELHDKHGDFNEQAVCKLALGYEGEDALIQGFEEYQNLIKSAENGVFEQAQGTPPAPEGPGSADTSGSRPTTFADAKAAALERMKASRQA